MEQIIVVEPDEIVALALKKAFAEDLEVKLIFKNDLKEIYELLNGSPTNKSVLQKLNSELAEIKKQFQLAAASDSAAKSAMENATEILGKHKSELEALKNPDPKLKKTEVETETPENIEKQKLELGVEILRLEESVKGLRDSLNITTKTKLEKERLLKETETSVDEAKLRVPPSEDQLYKVILISNKFLVPDAEAWIAGFRKAISFESNKEIKVVVLGFEFDEKTVKKFLISGISDYMIKPVDELLAKQNLKFLALGDSKAKREVYSLKINDPVDLIFEYDLKGLSEYSFVIESKESFTVNDFKAFNCDLFLRKGQKSVLGKCLSSKESGEGRYLSEFWFVGMDTHLSFQIKSVIKAAAKNV